MDPADFHDPSAGTIVQAPGGYAAFVPAPLPPELVYDAGLVLQLSRSDAALSELSGLGRQLRNPHLLIAPYVRREAVLSSRIEGTRASLSDLLLDEIEDGGQLRRRCPRGPELCRCPGVWPAAAAGSAPVAPAGPGAPRAADAGSAGRARHAGRAPPEPELDRTRRQLSRHRSLCAAAPRPPDGLPVRIGSSSCTTGNNTRS